jgi:hypothetical protein
MEPQEAKGGVVDLIKKLKEACESANVDSLPVDDKNGFILLTVYIESDNVCYVQGHCVGGEKIRVAIVKSLLEQEDFRQHVKDVAEEMLRKHVKDRLVLKMKGDA